MFNKAIFKIFLVCAFAVAPRLGLASEPTGASAPVHLKIVNGTATQPIACQIVLAHFVTQDIAQIPAGKSAVISLRRDLDDGTLIYQRDGGRRMAVENVLCGIANNWRATRNDLNISPLREGRHAALQFICETPKALSCNSRKGAE